MYRQKRSYENTTVKHSISGNSDNIYRDTKAGQEENMKKSNLKKLVSLGMAVAMAGSPLC